MQVSRPWAIRLYTGASVLSVFLALYTLVDPQWIERWFDESPDGGDGSAERWLVSGCFALLAVGAAWMSRRVRRQPA